MRRRDFISLVGGVTAWPIAARAQQPAGMRRVGVLLNLFESDVEGRRLVAVFQEGLAQLGWADGRNLRIDYRWASGDVDRIRAFAKELVVMSPDIIVAYATRSVVALQRETHSIPIVFLSVTDPGWPRPCRESGTSGREYYGLCSIRDFVRRQVDGGPQTDSARSQDGHYHLQSTDSTLPLTLLARDRDSRRVARSGADDGRGSRRC